MFIIEVIPIAKAIGASLLSYFTSQEIPLGAIVEIPLRKKIVHGIVISSRNAEEMKSEIRGASFSLKKLDKVKSKNFFGKAFIETAKEASDYYASSVGSAISAMVPEYIIKNIDKLKINEEESYIEKATKEKYAVQGNDEERYGAWKSLIRQEFARKHSLMFILPTIEEAEYAFSLLEKGISGYAFLLHGALTGKEIADTWNTISKKEHPVVTVCTPAFLYLFRKDTETIVVERENSRSYKIPRRPYLDMRNIAEIFARKRGVKIYFADDFLRLETLFRMNNGEIIEASPFKSRSLSTAEDALIDMRKYAKNAKSFKIISEEVENLIKRTKEESEHMIIFALRRGISPSVVCGDCQNIVTCRNCSAPVILHKAKSSSGNEKNLFMCHRCGERRSSEETCKVCGSWKLGTVGIGIDLVEDKIKDKFPDVSVFRFDSDTIANEKSAKMIMQKYRSKPGSILLGTEMMLQYLHEKVENFAIISLDSLFSIPDFRIQEKIMYTLVRMRSLTSRNFIVETRKADEKVFEYGLKGNINDFYRHAIAERKKFNYPPFSILLKITLEGQKDRIIKEMEEVQNILEPYEVEVFPAFTHTVRGNYILHGLIRLKNDAWIDDNLLQRLRSLPLFVSVKVDPENLL